MQGTEVLGQSLVAAPPPATRRGQHPPNYGRKFPAEPLSVTDVEKLLDACNRFSRSEITRLRNRALIVVLWRVGLRIAEALSLEVLDVDLVSRTIFVRDGKGHKARVVPIDPGACPDIEVWLQTRSPVNEWVFQSLEKHAGSGHLAYTTANETLKRLARQAGVRRRVHPHGMRHTCATELAREHWPIPVISAFLGHNSVATTHAYVRHLWPGELLALSAQRSWPLTRSSTS